MYCLRAASILAFQYVHLPRQTNVAVDYHYYRKLESNETSVPPTCHWITGGWTDCSTGLQTSNLPFYSIALTSIVFQNKFIVFISIFCSVTLPRLDTDYITLFCLIGRQTREVRCVRSDDLTPASANCCGEDLKPDSENLCFE